MSFGTRFITETLLPPNHNTMIFETDRLIIRRLHESNQSTYFDMNKLHQFLIRNIGWLFNNHWMGKYCVVGFNS
jgi:hypothetical protein